MEEIESAEDLLRWRGEAERGGLLVGVRLGEGGCCFRDLEERGGNQK